MTRITKIKTDDCILNNSMIQGNREFQTIWTLGDLDILKVPLTGIFCSIQCPGNVILRIYDLIRATDHPPIDWQSKARPGAARNR